MITPTTSRVSDAMREAFEKWITDPLQGGAFFGFIDTPLKLDEEGEFADTEAFGAYLAWQAALASLGDVAAVSDLRALQAYYVSWHYQELEPCEHHDPANGTVVVRLDDLSAILNRGGK